MTIRHIELLSVRAEDGLASDAELAELEAAGLDPSAWPPVRVLLQEVLACALPAPRRFALDVLSTLDLSVLDEHERDGLLLEALSPEAASTAAVTLADGVLSALELGPSDDQALHDIIRQALAAPTLPSLVDGVLSGLDLADDAAQIGADVRAVLAAAAAPELADAVLARLAREEGAVEEGTVDGAEVRSALQGEGPALADGVLARLGLQAAADLGAQVAEVLRPPSLTPAAALADGVLAALGLGGAETEGDATGALVRDVLQADAGASPELWSGIAAEIGAVEGMSTLLRDAVVARAGTVDLVDAVMAEIGASAPVGVPLAEVVPLRPTDRGLWTAALGGLLAAAAAALVVLLPGWGGGDGGVQPLDEAAFMVAEMDNTAEIESLEAGPDALVQFFQGEEGAPTIIFINELDAPEGSSGQDDGVPL